VELLSNVIALTCLSLRPESTAAGRWDLAIETTSIQVPGLGCAGRQDFIRIGGRIRVHRGCRQGQHSIVTSICSESGVEAWEKSDR
jgi:hypothetical protein